MKGYQLHLDGIKGQMMGTYSTLASLADFYFLKYSYLHFLDAHIWGFHQLPRESERKALSILNTLIACTHCGHTLVQVFRFWRNRLMNFFTSSTNCGFVVDALKVPKKFGWSS